MKSNTRGRTAPGRFRVQLCMLCIVAITCQPSGALADDWAGELMQESLGGRQMGSNNTSENRDTPARECLPPVAPGSVLWDDKPAVPTNVEPPPPFGWYPQGTDMGGFPPVPQIDQPPTTFHDLVLENVTVRTRSGGVLRLYGFGRGDVDVTTQLFNDLQNPFFVLPNDSHFLLGPKQVPMRPHSAAYSIYPRLTRVGLEYYGLPMERLGGAVALARLETDFLTSTPGQSESRQLIRLRLAYGQIKKGEWTLLAGQDWDIISPLNPSINDNTLQWNNGNMGDRRPQVKLLWDHKLDEDLILQVQNGIGLSDAINSSDLDGDGFRDNEAGGVPGWESRTGIIAPSWVEKKKVLGGVWSILGNTRVNAPIAGRRQFPLYAFGADLQLPLTEWLMFRSEIFHGANLDDYRGGIGQGINVLTGQSIMTTGGWAEVMLQTVPWHQLSLGYSTDDPINRQIAPGGRTLNRSIYIGNRFIGGNGLVCGVDVQDWSTYWNGFHYGQAYLVKTFMQVAF